MKRTIKITALCLSIVALTALFAGCDYLDEMKANHAVLSEDKSTISFKGETYKRLPETANLYSSYDYNNHSVTVTDSNVPVLLKNIYGYYTEYREEKDIFYVVFNSYNDMFNAYFDSNAEVYSSLINTVENYYCNEKDFDKYVNAIENSVLDHIGFEYQVEDIVDGYYYNYYYTLDVANSEVSSEILGYITNPEKMSSELFDEMTEDYSLECLMNMMYKCDADGVLAEILDGYDIQRDSKGNAYLFNYTAEKAVKLSGTVSAELKDIYFYGDYIYSDWYDDDSDLGIIGSADGETEMIVVNKYN